MLPAPAPTPTGCAWSQASLCKEGVGSAWGTGGQGRWGPPALGEERSRCGPSADGLAQVRTPGRLPRAPFPQSLRAAEGEADVPGCTGPARPWHMLLPTPRSSAPYILAQLRGARPGSPSRVQATRPEPEVAQRLTLPLVKCVAWPRSSTTSKPVPTSSGGADNASVKGFEFHLWTSEVMEEKGSAWHQAKGGPGRGFPRTSSLSTREDRAPLPAQRPGCPGLGPWSPQSRLARLNSKRFLKYFTGKKTPATGSEVRSHPRDTRPRRSRRGPRVGLWCPALAQQPTGHPEGGAGRWTSERLPRGPP